MFDFPNSPAVGQQATTPNGTVFTWDGAKWIAAGTTLIIAPTVPVANPGMLWWDSTGGQLYVNYNDGNSTQWVSSDSGIVANLGPAQNNVGRNLIHNPMWNIQQRGAGPFNTVAGAGYTYSVDRWRFVALAAGDSYSITTLTPTTDADRAAIGDESAAWVLTHNVAGGSGATNGCLFGHGIEGVRRLSGKTVTVSFWAQIAVGAKIGVSLAQEFGSGGSPSAQVIGVGQSVTSVSSAWTRYALTFTLPSTAGKTLGTDNNNQTSLEFWLSAGSSFATRTGGVGVQTGFFNMWGVQLEVGSVATPLEQPDPQQDWAKCQRFYQVGAASLSIIATGAAQGFGYSLPLPVPMRAAPTAVISNSVPANATGSAISWTAPNYITVIASATAAGGAGLNVLFNLSADL